MLLTTPVPHAEAARLIRGKLPATRKLFDAMEPELQAAAVVITGVEDLHAIERVRNLVAEIPEGGDWELAKDQIITELMPWLQDDEAAENRAELILRSHGYAAYAKANYAALEDQIEIFPWRKYQTAQDERVRGTHAALDGVIAPADSPFWRAHTPPWDFGCRCDIVGLTNDDVKELRGSNMRTAEGKPALKIIDRGPELEALEQGNLYRDGVMNFVARNPDGFKFDPEGGLVTLEMLQGLKKRVGAKLWDGFADWARNAAVPGSGNAWDYLTKPVRRRKPAAVVPTIPVPAPAPVVPPVAPVKKGRLTPVEKKREEIRTALYKSEQKLGGGVNSSAILRNGVTVVFKSAIGETKQVMRTGIAPGTQFKREVAASLVDEFLGTGLVPPVAEITWNGNVGSAMLLKNRFKHGGLYPDAAAVMGFDRELLERWQLFDDVVGHLDRHPENWMMHGKSVALIDNGLCLSETPIYSLSGLWTRFKGPMHGRPLSSSSIDSLRQFQARRGEVEAAIGGLVPPRAIQNMWDRVDTMLRTNKHGI